MNNEKIGGNDFLSNAVDSDKNQEIQEEKDRKKAEEIIKEMEKYFPEIRKDKLRKEVPTIMIKSLSVNKLRTKVEKN